MDLRCAVASGPGFSSPPSLLAAPVSSYERAQWSPEDQRVLQVSREAKDLGIGPLWVEKLYTKTSSV